MTDGFAVVRSWLTLSELDALRADCNALLASVTAESLQEAPALDPVGQPLDERSPARTCPEAYLKQRSCAGSQAQGGPPPQAAAAVRNLLFGGDRIHSLLSAAAEAGGPMCAYDLSTLHMFAEQFVVKPATTSAGQRRHSSSGKNEGAGDGAAARSAHSSGNEGEGEGSVNPLVSSDAEEDGGAPYGWHTDAAEQLGMLSEPCSQRYCTVWLALDDCLTPANGPLTVLPASARAGVGLDASPGDPADACPSSPGDASPGDPAGSPPRGESVDGMERNAETLLVPAGSAVVMPHNLLHRSGPNRTLKPRRAYMIQVSEGAIMCGGTPLSLAIPLKPAPAVAAAGAPPGSSSAEQRGTKRHSTLI